MGKSSIGDSFSDRIKNHQEPIDHDQLIADMDLASKNRKRPIFWILFVSLFVGIIGAAVFYGWGQNDLNDLSEDSRSAEDLTTELNIESKEIEKPKEGEYAQQISRDQVAVGSKNNNRNKQVHTDEISSDIENNTSTVKATQTKNDIDALTLEKQTTNQVTYSQKNNSLLPADTTVINEEVNLLEETPKTRITETEANNSKNETVSKQINAINEENSAAQVDSKEEDTRLIEGVSPPQIVASSKTEPAQRIDYPESTLLSLITKESLVQPALRFPDLRLTKINRDSPSLWSLSIQSEIFTFSNDILAKNIEGTDYAQVRSNLENPLEGFSSGVLLQYDISKFLYIKSGVQYDRYNRSFNYQENILESVEESVVTEIYVDYLGDTTTVSGVVAAEKNISRYWTRTQHLNQINVPIYLGFYNSFGKWRTYAEAGIHLNVFQWFDGAILDESLTIVTDSDIYKSSFANQASFGAGAVYKVNRKIGIDVSMQYSRTLNNLTKDSYSLEENMQRLGMRLGIAYRF